jgi:hypothetical protein
MAARAMAFGRALTMLMPAETTLVLGSLILIVLGVWIVVARILALRDPCPTTTAPLRPRGHVVPSGARIRPRLVVEAISFSGVRPGVARVPPVAPPCLRVLLPLLAVGGGSAVGSSLGRRVVRPRGPLIALSCRDGASATALPGRMARPVLRSSPISVDAMVVVPVSGCSHREHQVATYEKRPRDRAAIASIVSVPCAPSPDLLAQTRR